MFDPVYIILLLALGFAIYGIDQLGERFRGHHLSSAAEESLDELCDYCDEFLRSGPVAQRKYGHKIRRFLKPNITETALRQALDDLEANGDESVTAVWLKQEFDRVLTALQHSK